MTQESLEEFTFMINDGKVDKELFLNNIAECNPFCAEVQNKFASATFNCRHCAESFIMDYVHTETDDISAIYDSVNYTVMFQNAFTDGIPDIIRHMDIESYSADFEFASITFKDLDTVKVFIAIYNDTLDELEDEYDAIAQDDAES
jgi:hypothetical protein